MYTGMGSIVSEQESGWRGSNPRPSPWQGDALPLSHNRKRRSFCSRGSAIAFPIADRVGVEPTSSGFRAQARDQPTLRPSVPLSREREGRNPMYRILHTACAAVAAGRSDAPASGAGIEPANAGVKAPLPRHQSTRNRGWLSSLTEPGAIRARITSALHSGVER